MRSLNWTPPWTPDTFCSFSTGPSCHYVLCHSYFCPITSFKAQLDFKLFYEPSPHASCLPSRAPGQSGAPWAVHPWLTGSCLLPSGCLACDRPQSHRRSAQPSQSPAFPSPCQVSGAPGRKRGPRRGRGRGGGDRRRRTWYLCATAASANTSNPRWKSRHNSSCGSPNSPLARSLCSLRSGAPLALPAPKRSC